MLISKHSPFHWSHPLMPRVFQFTWQPLSNAHPPSGSGVHTVQVWTLMDAVEDALRALLTPSNPFLDVVLSSSGLLLFPTASLVSPNWRPTLEFPQPTSPAHVESTKCPHRAGGRNPTGTAVLSGIRTVPSAPPWGWAKVTLWRGLYGLRTLVEPPSTLYPTSLTVLSWSIPFTLIPVSESICGEHNQRQNSSMILNRSEGWTWVQNGLWLTLAITLRAHVHATEVASVMSSSLWPHGLWPARLLCPWNSPGKYTGVGCCFFLHGIFPTQRLNPHLLRLLHCRQILYHWATGEVPAITLPMTICTHSFQPREPVVCSGWRSKTVAIREAVPSLSLRGWVMTVPSHSW